MAGSPRLPSTGRAPLPQHFRPQTGRTPRAIRPRATDIPDSTADLIARFAEVPRGLYCHELLDPEVNAYPFSQRSTPATNFLWSLVYWSLEGEPNRMDEDQNGIPCETLYDPEVVADVLGGGSIQ